ncbi:NAD(P)-binding protein [Rhizodiscina lignyota]|uniref:NAD(P)-binding protein n=1 Tax=Rhizodiscina lignyota TaxID=1504668 RepID=A0A9P4IKQ4_9PEZI|nr:NAD(P)-binding protein [Rhizodiscina lignyota]
MLILVAGITGNVGQEMALAAFNAGHSVRGLSRNPSKLPESISSKLESFVTSKSSIDIPALDVACSGVDAIVCAYKPEPEPSLDGQLMLLRAAERSGVKRFHAASWNLDWSGLPLGEHETYDAYISFLHHARVSSPIKPLYTFCGVLAKTFFAVPKAGKLEDNSSFWQRIEDGKRRINVLGTGDEMYDFTPEEDAAAFTIALITSEKAENGGVYYYCSDSFTLKQWKETYERITGREVEWNVTGLTGEMADGLVQKMRSEALANDQVREKLSEYIGLVYVKYLLNGGMGQKRSDRDMFPQVAAHRKTLEEYIKKNPEF